MLQPTVAVVAEDPIVKDGAAAYLSGVEEVRLVSADMQPIADVVLILAAQVTTTTLSCMRDAVRSTRNPDMRIVLVADDISEMQLLRAIDYGLAGLLLRPTVDYAQVVKTILACREGTILPSTAIRTLADYVKRVHSGVLPPHGFTRREIEVLKMVADGVGTAEIAAQLQYSERTIKNILNSAMKRLSLRNRAHAVSYAMRAGAL